MNSAAVAARLLLLRRWPAALLALDFCEETAGGGVGAVVLLAQMLQAIINGEQRSARQQAGDCDAQRGRRAELRKEGGLRAGGEALWVPS